MLEVHNEIFNRLVDQLTVSVYSHIPQDKEYPFIHMTNYNIESADTDNELAFDGTMDIIAYDDGRGCKTVMEMEQNIYNALHRYQLPDTVTYGVIDLRREYAQIVKSGDEHMALTRYRVTFETL